MTPRRFEPFKLPAAIFIVLMVAFFAGRNWLAGIDIDYRVLMGGNLILFAISVVTTTLLLNSLNDKNPHAFTRTMSLCFIIRLFACAIAATLYIVASKSNLNKYGLFACMAIYFLYTFVEVAAMQKILRNRKHA